MLTWFSGIGGYIINFVAPFTLIIVALIVEKNFVSRLTIFANSIAVNLFFYSINIPDILGWYLNIALVWGGIGLFARATNTKLGSWYYTPAWLFSSIAVGAILLYFTFNPIAATAIPLNLTNTTR